jgi:amidase
MTLFEIDEVIRTAESLGLSIGRDEAAVYRGRLVERMSAIEEFMRTPFEENRPISLASNRAPGRRPTSDEDPFHAWLWKCEVNATTSGLLAGKTVSFKDHIAMAGIPMTMGSHEMQSYTPDFDATIVTRALAAGATIVGKNNMNGPTNAWGWGVRGDFQRPLNPHDPNHLTGGSSSGSAVAVATRQVDISFGGDQGGSIRLPAAYCGVYGLKPTFGLVPHFGVGFGMDPSLDYTGPMTRYARDLALALDAVAGYDGLDPRQDRTVPAGSDAIACLGRGVSGISIGLLEEAFVDVESNVRDAVLAAVDVLVAAGAEVMRVSVPALRPAALAFAGLEPAGSRAIFDVGFAGAFAKTYYPTSLIAAAYALYHEHTEQLIPRLKLELLLSEFVRKRFHGMTYAKAQNVRGSIRKMFDDVFAQVQVLIMPTTLEVAPRYVEHGPDLDDAAFGLPARNRNTEAFNLTGHPALSVPCGKSNGLPVGMQLVGPYYADSLLVQVADAFEHSIEWDALIRVPPAAG